jgi:thiamine pyrophosphate-dependent acetolactate synthase large subunit-like protein
MKRAECAALVQRHVRDEDIVVCGLGGVEAAYKEVGAAGITYFASDPMGLWPSIALGLALAQPERRVVFLAGDGDLVMNLQVLITIASLAPPNLRIVVFQNGVYASSGGQPLGGADKLSIAAIARGAGFACAIETRELAATRAALEELFARDALGLVAVHLEQEPPSPSAPPAPWSQVEERTRFMQRLLGKAGGA